MRLRHRIEIQRDHPTQDATGQPVSDWLTVRKCWANVNDVMNEGGERQQAAKITAIAESEVVIRYPQDGTLPTARDRIKYREGSCVRTLNIESVKRIDRVRRMMVLRCSESQDG